MMHHLTCASHQWAWCCGSAYVARTCLSKLLSLLVVACLVKKQLKAALASMLWQLHVTRDIQKICLMVCGCCCLLLLTHVGDEEVRGCRPRVLT